MSRIKTNYLIMHGIILLLSQKQKNHRKEL